MPLSAPPIPLRLKPGRQFPFLARHPWVHAHALADHTRTSQNAAGQNAAGQSPGAADGVRDLVCGQIVDLLDHDGNWIARGVANPASRLRVRLYAFDSQIEIGPDLWRTRINAAISRRRFAGEPVASAALRLVFSESDLLSGLIVDRYADYLSVQFTAGGLLRWKDEILTHLAEVTNCRGILVRVDEKTAKHEGIEAIDSWARGEPASDPVPYRQNDLDLAVDLNGGQKTGGYLDQRVNHLAAAGYLSGRRVLDVCCYTGGFGLVAAQHGAASVLGVDSSEAALAAARQNAQRNAIHNIDFVKSDCFNELKRLGDEGEKFDAVILDPPRFAGSRHQTDTALRAYRRLNSLAVDLLESGGILVTCSCSGRVSRSDFLNMLLDVGRRRRKDLIVLETRGPAPDHPVAVACPESDYLKCVIAEVVGSER